MKLHYFAGLAVGEGYFGLTVSHTKHHGLKIRPVFTMQMNDKESIAIAAEILKGEGLSYRISVEGSRIDIEGLKRMSRFLAVILPYLTGHKRNVALVVNEWVEYRLSQPYHHVNYTEKDITLVNRVRSMNAGNGKNKIIPVSILRDYTSSTRPKRVEDIVHPSAKAVG